MKAKKLTCDDELEAALKWGISAKEPVFLDMEIPEPTQLIPPVV